MASRSKEPNSSWIDSKILRLASRDRAAQRIYAAVPRARRLAAAAKGEGFMSFRIAELRLRRALIKVLASSNTDVVATARASLFSTIFETANG